MINQNFEAVLIDFGVCAVIEGDDKLKQTQGSLMFYAPEMFTLSDEQGVEDIRG